VKNLTAPERPMPSPLAELQRMTIEDFLEFTDTRPDGERWELIEGVPVMNPSPTNWHQTIVVNLVEALGSARSQSTRRWVALLGTGTRVPASSYSLPQPDVMVVSALTDTPTPVADDALAIFDMLSKSNTKADQAWRRQVYASVPGCQHYVTIDSRKVDAVRYDRAAGWKRAAHLTSLGEQMALDGLGVTLGVADLYRWTPLGSA
jgi:Uma2 family endonuclease